MVTAEPEAILWEKCAILCWSSFKLPLTDGAGLVELVDHGTLDRTGQANGSDASPGMP